MTSRRLGTPQGRRLAIDTFLKDTKVNTLNSFRLLGIATLLALGVAACDSPPGPMESAGKKLDLTVQDAGKAMGNLAKAQEAARALRDAGVTYDRNTPL